MTSLWLESWTLKKKEGKGRKLFWIVPSSEFAHNCFPMFIFSAFSLVSRVKYLFFQFLLLLCLFASFLKYFAFFLLVKLEENLIDLLIFSHTEQTLYKLLIVVFDIFCLLSGIGKSTACSKWFYAVFQWFSQLIVNYGLQAFVYFWYFPRGYSVWSRINPLDVLFQDFFV